MSNDFNRIIFLLVLIWLFFTYRRNSEEFRFELSKKLLEECEQSRNEQIQRLKLQQEAAEAEENALVQESRRQQIEEVCLDFLEN